jgi:hypothetical protein
MYMKVCWLSLSLLWRYVEGADNFVACFTDGLACKQHRWQELVLLDALYSP